MRKDTTFVGVCLMLICVMSACAAAPDDVADRRTRMLEAGAQGAAKMPLLRNGLQDESPLVRRAAIRGLAPLGTAAEEILIEALDNADAVVRRAALMALTGDLTPASMPYLRRALADEDTNIRELGVRLLVAMTPRNEEVLALMRKAEEDEAPKVHRVAGLALAAMDPDIRPFEIAPLDTVLLRDRPEMADRLNQIVTVLEMPLPLDDWRFRRDTRLQGHRENWFEVDFDDSEWGDISIGTAWAPGYIGVGWYRREIELPAEPEHLAAELLFEGVDECAWVWVNGEYVGGQDVGPAGWSKPFRVDVTDALRWGEANQITIRAMNTAAAGGIWKPVTLEALALK